MAAAYPGGAPNTYIPSTEATNNMIVDFSRAPDDFPVNKYTTIVKVDKSVGRYCELSVEQRGRVLNTDLKDRMWADGDDASDGRGQLEAFEFKPYETTRFEFPFRIGEKAAGEASWDILASHARIKAQEAMTARTQKHITLLTTSGNWPSGHTSAVSAISGVTGKWDVSTTARADIKRSLNYAIEQILKATLSAVDVGDLQLVISPELARKISVSQEIVDYLKSSPDALDWIRGKVGKNSVYGLPDSLYGIPLVVENTVKVTNKKGATKATSYVLAATTPFIVSRPGSLNGTGDSSSPRYSTCCTFMLEEMTVWSKHDQDNRNHKGRVVEDYDVRLTAPISGFLFTAACD